MIFPKHIDYLEKTIEKLIESKKDKVNILTISMPPRSGKTSYAFERFPEWYSKKYPEDSITMCGFNRDVLENRTKNIYNNNIRKITVGEAPYGFPIDLFILDNICKRADEINSEIYQKKLLEWISQVVYIRMNQAGLIVIFGTRYSQNDLIGRLITKLKGKDPYVNLVNINIPAIQNSESYWPEKYSIKYLHELQNLIGNKIFNASYMGNPLE